MIVIGYCWSFMNIHGFMNLLMISKVLIILDNFKIGYQHIFGNIILIKLHYYLRTV